jgi:alpha-L-arabinofuranosidase
MLLLQIIRQSVYGIAAAVLLCTVSPGAAQSMPIYTDSLLNGWTDGSYNCTHSFANTSPVHSGSDSISATVSSAYGGIQLNHSGMTNTAYTSISFWLNGGASGGQQLQMYGTLNNVAQGARYSVSTPPANTWQQYIVPLSSLGVANAANFTGFAIQDRAGTSEPTFYLDDIQLINSTVPALVHVGVNASQALRQADARWFGLNTAIWDSYFDTTYTANALHELGTQILRFPGGSASDDYNWVTGMSGNNSWAWATSFGNFMHIATNAGVQAIITVNYGDGTAQEAAAWVTNANLIHHCNFKYWEVGNENYGTWENDSNTYPHDPYTYAVRAAQYMTQMRAADSTIRIGVPVVTGEDSNDNGYSSHPAYNARTSSYHNGWTPVVLATLKSLGVMPDFLVYHVYPEYGSDSDAGLLQASGNWAGDAPNLRQQINDYVGTAGTNIELICTENNADAGNQGKQSTSIVNGLYLADSLAQLMKTEFNGFVWWDLRNGTDTSGDFDSSLYGWRSNGDLGIIGNQNTRYPTFFTFKLMQYFARPGDSVLNATSDFGQLSTYAARKADGALALLVINKHSSSNLNAQIVLTDFAPWSNATARSFGILQDEATRTNSVIPGAQDIATNSFGVTGTNFNAVFPPYSLTLLTLAPAAPTLQTISANGGQYIFQLQGQPGAPYVIQNSADMATWIPVATNTLSGSTLNVTNTIDPGMPVQFWRAVWLP